MKDAVIGRLYYSLSIGDELRAMTQEGKRFRVL